MWINNQKKEKVIYTGLFVENIEALKAKYLPVHTNEFYHHSTIEYRPETWVDRIDVGEKTSIRIIGRVTTDKVDALIVENPKSKNENPHITLSTAEGIKPFESNNEIKAAIADGTVINVEDTIELTEWYFNGKKEIISLIDNTTEQVKDILY